MSQSVKIIESVRTSIFSSRWLDVSPYQIEDFKGNKTVDAVANPVLYKAIIEETLCLAGMRSEISIANFGARTLRMENDLLFQSLANVDADSLAHFRKLKVNFISLEKSPLLLKEGLRDIVNQQGREIPIHGIIHNAQEFPVLMPDQSLDLAVSRMLLINLHFDGLKLHLIDTSRLLKSGSKYIAVVLNPEYQEALLKQIRPEGFKVQSQMLFQFPIGGSENNINAGYIYYTIDDYLSAFQYADFSAVEIQKIGMTERSFHPMFLMITAIK